MLAAFVVVFVVTGNAYCKSLPPQPQSTDINVESFNGNSVSIIRKVRQTGSDYNPYHMYPDTGRNPNTYPQQHQQSNNNFGSYPVDQYPTIFAGKK